MVAAQELLTTYLARNGRGSASPQHTLPMKGKVHLLPHVTWTMDAEEKIISEPD
jgi:hypothetical protein